MTNLWFVMMDGKDNHSTFFSVFKTSRALIVFSHLTAFLRYSGTSLQFVSSAAAELQWGTGGELNTHLYLRALTLHKPT